MAYNKVHPDGWHNAPNNTTPITADAMNTIEQGVYDNSQQLGTLAPLASPAFTGTPTVNGSPIGSGSSAVFPVVTS